MSKREATGRSRETIGNAILPLLTRLRRGAALDIEDEAALTELFNGSIRQIKGHIDLISQGDRPGRVQLILSGFACRYKILPNGRRQIMAYLLPGDFCDLNVAILGQMDHNISTLTPCAVAQASGSALEELIATRSRIARALWWANLVEESVLREWLVNVGQRPAHQRVANLFCELAWRLRAAGLEQPEGFDFPITQQDLGHALGLSAVHINRVVQDLRATGLIRLQGGRLALLKPDTLAEMAMFDPVYLHLGTEAHLR
ncbi:Crp/Fnr family transcriptional regulator [Afifella sp. JA880]|uniref:Crp/Fnr family transcriptional regulator n=1 Tax=Afifella sp. JA880 TaxID=2975280 RepID=UPI0021BBB42D|nr:Crp/Fnr family transcriptional regulator [Afifella sp. JA880]MCT8266398.1 Crp/Fnr family transcriptional regulator [Afifella sp. JA880]